MKLEEFQARRKELAAQAPNRRPACHTCRQSKLNCYCDHVRRFDPRIEFLILTHPIEVQRRIATGRMSYLCLQNSHLITGENFSEDPRVNQFIKNPDYQVLLLYPGRDSNNLSLLKHPELRANFLLNKKLLIVVIDGTWATARRMVRLSKNLCALPRICFSRDRPSTFRVRKQPAAGCYSTIEAIHEIIELIGVLYGFPIASRQHDNLLTVFNHLVEQQLRFIPEHIVRRRQSADLGS